MIESEVDHLLEEVQQLRRAYRQQRWLLTASLVAVVGFTYITATRPTSAMAFSADEEGILHVRGLVVEDATKHERLRLGAPLPDPLIHGVRVKRKGAISGVVITDANGNERGGYVTSDQYGEAFLSLDSENEQEVLFLANPKGGVNFDIFDGKRNEAQLTVFPAGPKLTMTRLGEKILELPAAR